MADPEPMPPTTAQLETRLKALEAALAAYEERFKKAEAGWAKLGGLLEKHGPQLEKMLDKYGPHLEALAEQFFGKVPSKKPDSPETPGRKSRYF